MDPVYVVVKGDLPDIVLSNLGQAQDIDNLAEWRGASF